VQVLKKDGKNAPSMTPPPKPEPETGKDQKPVDD
jgi:hypothetical protein